MPLDFYQRAKAYMEQGPFHLTTCVTDEHGWETVTYDSKIHAGQVFKIVGRGDEFCLVQKSKRIYFRVEPEGNYRCIEEMQHQTVHDFDGFVEYVSRDESFRSFA